jgi:hypothetical protein
MIDFSGSRDCGSFAKVRLSLMKKLRLLGVFIALAAFTACQRQTEEQKNTESERDVQQQLVSPSTSPENPYRLKSQARRFQPRQIVPMAQTPTPTAEPSPIER